MKKKITLLLTALLSLTCLIACGKEETNAPSAAMQPKEGDSSAALLQTETPDFPENDFGKDNEAIYPNAWN